MDLKEQVKIMKNGQKPHKPGLDTSTPSRPSSVSSTSTPRSSSDSDGELEMVIIYITYFIHNTQ